MTQQLCFPRNKTSHITYFHLATLATNVRRFALPKLTAHGVQEGPQGIRLLSASCSAWMLSKYIILILCIPWPSLCFKLQLFFSLIYSKQPGCLLPAISHKARKYSHLLHKLPFTSSSDCQEAFCTLESLSLRGKIITPSWGSSKILSRDFLGQILRVLLTSLTIPALIIHLPQTQPS